MNRRRPSRRTAGGASPCHPGGRRHVSPVFRFLPFLITCVAALHAAPLEPNPATVAVLYNSAQPESKKLAETYAAAREIPEENLIGLPLAAAEEISRADFNKTLRTPLIGEFDRRQWWQRAKNPQGSLQPVQLRIRTLVCVRGVPSRIKRETTPNAPPPKEGEPPFARSNEAAVDSELALLGIEGLPLDGFVNNPYFKSEKPFLESGLPMTLVGRIDGPTWEICERMIRDAIETEQTGLWGMAVADLSRKFPEGDQWIEDIVATHLETGIPTLVDRFADTLPTNYPLRDTAIYYGWYDWNVSGPFLNPDFRFRKGAVAVHIHSFSAAQLRDPQKNWSGPLLARGAAATLGNVYEPYLQMTHHLNIFHRRLLAGYTLAEAAYMALPVLSWQNVVLGDPLYRPFLHLDGTGEKAGADRDYRALRLAKIRWGNEAGKMENMLHEAADRLDSGVLVEALGLNHAARNMGALAGVEFKKAKALYKTDADRLRMDLLQAAIDREAGRNATALQDLRTARSAYAHLPEASAAAAWLTILDPPPPPPAAPKR